MAQAFALEDPAAAEVVRLLVVEGLVGKGNAQAVTRCEVGRRQGDVRVGCVNSVSRTDPRGFAGKSSVRTLRLASDGNCQPAALRGGQLSLLLARSDRLEQWGANTCVPPVSPRFLSSRTES